jgi:hypothetical protein
MDEEASVGRFEVGLVLNTGQWGVERKLAQWSELRAG